MNDKNKNSNLKELSIRERELIAHRNCKKDIAKVKKIGRKLIAKHSAGENTYGYLFSESHNSLLYLNSPFYCKPYTKYIPCTYLYHEIIPFDECVWYRENYAGIEGIHHNDRFVVCTNIWGLANAMYLYPSYRWKLIKHENVLKYFPDIKQKTT